MNLNGSSDNNDIMTKNIQENKYELKVYDNFEKMNLKKNLLRGIYARGFETPSPIQSKAIKPIIDGKDLIAQSQSGTGKTGSFTIGILETIDLKTNYCQCIILAPTRELAIQINDEISSISKFLLNDTKKKYKIVSMCMVGGTSIKQNISDIYDLKPCIIVGTPGRIYDMIKRKVLITENVKNIIIDEADEMLSQGFNEQMCKIFNHIPRDVQISLFSATLPNEIIKMTDKFMREPVKILLDRDLLTLEGIKQYYVILDNEDQKNETIIDIYDNMEVAQSVIFCNTKKKVEVLSSNLSFNKFTVSCIYSSIDKKEREKVMKDFTNGTTRILITTDLLSRGIDVQHVNLVINYDIPVDKETYLHRIGRSGRYGRKGIAINLITKNDFYAIQAIEAYYNTVIEEMPDDFYKF